MTMRPLLLIIMSVVATAACTTHANDDRYELADKLTSLSKAAEGEVRYSDIPATSTTIEARMKRQHPQLLAYFEGYELRYQVEDKHVGVLLCEGKGSYLIAEDAGCTAPLERISLNDTAPCSFTLVLPQVCK